MVIKKLFLVLIIFQLSSIDIFAQDNKNCNCTECLYFKELDLLFYGANQKSNIHIGETKTYKVSNDSTITLLIIDCHRTAFGYISVKGQKQVVFMYKGKEDTISDIITIKDKLNTNDVIEPDSWYYKPQLIA